MQCGRGRPAGAPAPGRSRCSSGCARSTAWRSTVRSTPRRCYGRTAPLVLEIGSGTGRGRRRRWPPPTRRATCWRSRCTRPGVATLLRRVEEEGLRNVRVAEADGLQVLDRRAGRRQPRRGAGLLPRPLAQGPARQAAPGHARLRRAGRRPAAARRPAARRDRLGVVRRAGPQVVVGGEPRPRAGLARPRRPAGRPASSAAASTAGRADHTTSSPGAADPHASPGHGDPRGAPGGSPA